MARTGRGYDGLPLDEQPDLVGQAVRMAILYMEGREATGAQTAQIKR